MIKGTEQTIDLGDGRSISIETGKLAKQADGSVVLRCGGTMLLATVVSDKSVNGDVDFLPLTVEYKEKFAAAGRFPGGFLKREARPTDAEILVCRLIDRALRPLFPDDYHSNTQVIVNLVSMDEETMPDSLACLAASAAIAVSDIPFNGPVSEVRVARVDGKFVVNPTLSALETADIDMMIAATYENIMMVEGEMSEVSEADMLEAIKIGHEAIKVQCTAQKELAAQIEKSLVKREYCHEDSDEALYAKIKEACYQPCYDIAKQGNPSKVERKAAFGAVKEAMLETLTEEEAGKDFLVGQYFKKVEKAAVRRSILDENIRLDGRAMNQVRPIWSEVNYLPSTHGSSVFTRGETQSLTSITLGGKMDEQLIDGVFISGKSNFLLHYNFPSFSTGEARPNRGTSRREVGHGNLALRALKPVLPEDFPYTLRIVSEILESNGSSSMATVCAGSLAMMDAGIPVSKAVSGIAMGMISDENGKYAILSDILGDEDHLGDMDFKVTGTVDGITACQMDIKIDGLPYETLAEALTQARDGRLHILGEMAKTIDAPAEDYKPHVPRLVQIKVPGEFIGAIIGPGGKIIQEIQKETETTITIQEVDEEGVVDILSPNKESIDKALAWIKGIVAVPDVGETYEGKVKSIVAFGAFVEILPGKDGLLHISEIDHKRVEKVEDELKEGQMVKVKLLAIDPKNGKLKLSRKALIEKPKREAAPENA